MATPPPPPTPPLPGIPPGGNLVLGRIFTVLELAGELLNLVQITQNLIEGPEETSLAERLQTLQFVVDGIAAELDPNLVASLKAVLEARTAVILADTQELTEVSVPAILTAIGEITEPPSAPVVASAILDAQLYVHPQANNQVTVRQSLAHAGRQGLVNYLFGFTRLYANPDFALTGVEQTRILPLFNTYDPGDLTPRTRPPGESVLAYLQRVQPTKEWQTDGTIIWRYLRDASNQVAAWLLCLVQDLPEQGHPAMPDYADELAGIKSDTEAIAAGTSDLLLDVAVVQAVAVEIDADVDVLLARTVDTAEADDKIIATDFDAGDPVDLGDMPDRIRQYMPLKGEGDIGLATVISGAGSLFLGDRTSIVLVDVIAVPPHWSGYSDSPEWFRALGTVTFGFNGSWGQAYTIHRLQEWIRVPAGADSLAWSMKGGMECTIQLVAAS